MHSPKMGRMMAMFVCGLALSACGDSGDSTSPSTGNAAQGGGTTSAVEPNGGSGSGKQDGSQPSADTGGSVAAAGRVTALRVSGGGSDQFRVKGGDNSVQEFGEEGDDGELEEAAQIVHDFYAARATGDWSAACALFSESLLERFEELAESTPDVEDTRCAPFLAYFTADLPASEWRLITTVDAGSLRQEGEQGFLIYHGPDRTVYAMPLLDEDGTWKINALSSAQLPGT